MYFGFYIICTILCVLEDLNSGPDLPWGKWAATPGPPISGGFHQYKKIEHLKMFMFLSYPAESLGHDKKHYFNFSKFFELVRVPNRSNYCRSLTDHISVPYNKIRDVTFTCIQDNRGV